MSADLVDARAQLARAREEAVMRYHRWAHYFDRFGTDAASAFLHAVYETCQSECDALVYKIFLLERKAVTSPSH